MDSNIFLIHRILLRMIQHIYFNDELNHFHKMSIHYLILQYKFYNVRGIFSIHLIN